MAASIERLFDARRELVAGRATTCGRRWPRCRPCSRRWRTAWPSPRRPPRPGEQVAVLVALVDDLFELARIDAGALSSSSTTRCSSRSWRCCLRGARPRRRRCGTRRSNPTSRRRRGRGCAPEKVERVLFNLLTNALRHTPADGSVAVRAEQLDREVHVTCRGHGRRARRRGTHGGCSTGSGEATLPAQPAAPGSASRSPAGSSRPTAAGSGPRPPRGRRTRLVHPAGCFVAGRNAHEGVASPEARRMIRRRAQGQAGRPGRALGAAVAGPRPVRSVAADGLAACARATRWRCAIS